MLIYASVPPLTAVLGWLVFGETLGGLGLAGMALTMAGISLVVLQRGGADSAPVRLSHPLRGVAFAFIGSLGQAVGLVLSKVGAPSYNAFAATQIRVMAALVGFAAVILARRRLAGLLAAVKNRPAMGLMAVGSFFGPFLGVSLGLLSVQLTSTGVASTIMSITPVLIIPPSVLLFKEPVNGREVLGALIAVAGVALLFLG
jgi:drug/metabolite transporter (DMT)-like permease